MTVRHFAGDVARAHLGHTAAKRPSLTLRLTRWDSGGRTGLVQRECELLKLRPDSPIGRDASARRPAGSSGLASRRQATHLALGGVPDPCTLTGTASR